MLKICSANILNDLLTSKNPYLLQRDRLPELARDIQDVCDGSPDVLFICEASSKTNIEILATLLDMDILSDSYQYSKNDYMAFLIRPHLKHETRLEKIHYSESTTKHGMLRAHIGKYQFFGVHYPYRVVRDSYYRMAFSQLITDRLQTQPTIAFGDFNSLSWMPSQQLLKLSGMKRVRWTKAPRTPNPQLHGITAPHFVPSAVIDAMFYTANITISNQRWHYSKTTDHPLLYAEIS